MTVCSHGNNDVGKCGVSSMKGICLYLFMVTLMLVNVVLGT